MFVCVPLPLNLFLVRLFLLDAVVGSSAGAGVGSLLARWLNLLRPTENFTLKLFNIWYFFDRSFTFQIQPFLNRIQSFTNQIQPFIYE